MPNVANATNIASMKPQSPMRLVTNAFFPALALASTVNQKEMRKYEHAPTPSHPTNVKRRLSDMTRMSIEKMNRFMYTKNLENCSSPCMYPMA